MLSNNIEQIIKMIPLFSRDGSQSILSAEHTKSIINMIPAKSLSDPATTYQDVQCGTGFIMLSLANRLMETLKKAIPSEQDRLAHIFGQQLFLSDINTTQVRIARANLLKAINNRDFHVNVENLDCFTNTRSTTYTLGSIDFNTTNKFVPYYKKLSENIIIVTRSNKNRYVDSKLNEVYAYKFLGIAKNSTPMCLMHFKTNKKNNDVIFINGDKQITINNPSTIPGEDFAGYQFLEEVLSKGFVGYRASGGPERPAALANPGKIPMIFNVGKKGAGFGDIIKVDKSIVTAKTGFGKEKIIVSKTGNRGKKSILKKAGAEYAVGANSYWVEMAEKDADKFIKVWNEEPCIDKLVCVILETKKCNGVKFWAMIPNIKYLKEVKSIYDKYYKSSSN
jgi:hypothetical protein